MRTNSHAIAPRRSRGASAVEYIVVLVMVAITGVAVYKRLGADYKCKVATATGLFGGGNAPECSPASSTSPQYAQNDPSPNQSSDCPNGVCMRPGKCFVAGTPVVTESGLQPIESIVVGMRVLSRSEAGDRLEWKPVTRTFMRRAPALVHLEVADAVGSDESFELTPEHRVFAAGRGWVAAATLTPGRDLLIDADGAPMAVRAAESLDHGDVVFNLEVADDHTYFAGQHPVWVHNGCWDPKTVENTGVLPPTNAGNTTGPQLTYHHIVPRNSLSSFLSNVVDNQDLQLLQPALNNIIDIQYCRVSDPTALEDQNGQPMSPDDLKQFIDDVARNNVHNGNDSAADLANQMYQWMPGDIVHGPSNRGDDPGPNFDAPVKPIVGDKKFQTLEELNNLINQYNADKLLPDNDPNKMKPQQRADLLRKIASRLNEINKQNRPYPHDPKQWGKRDGKPCVKS